MRASTSTSRCKGKGRGGQQGQKSFTPCTYHACKSKDTHPIERCFKKQNDEAAAKVKDLEGQLQKARLAQSEPKEAEEAAFAGNASVFDFTDPRSPLLSDAGTDFIADTGATRHMTPHRHFFHSYTPCRIPIRLANHKVVHSTGRGSIRFQPVVNGRSQQLLEFYDVLHVPDLRSNLLSVLYLTTRKSYKVVIDDLALSFMRANKVVFTASINSDSCATLV